MKDSDEIYIHAIYIPSTCVFALDLDLDLDLEIKCSFQRKHSVTLNHLMEYTQFEYYENDTAMFRVFIHASDSKS